MKKIVIQGSRIQGKGIFADEDIRRGELIQYIIGRKVRKMPKSREEALSIPNWFGVSRKYWIDPGESAFRYLNHSCEPDAAIKGTKSLIALRDIKKGEEITIDYSMTDADPLWEMECACKAPTCRKVIHSIESVPPAVFERHMPNIPRYFQRVYLRNYVNKDVKSRSNGPTAAHP